MRTRSSAIRPIRRRLNHGCVRSAERFLWAGSSALLLAIASVNPKAWLLMMMALVPFFWRVTRDHVRGALFQGILLATSYSLVVRSADLWSAPETFLSLFFCLNLVFAAYAVSINWLYPRIGFNVVFVAASWLALEYALRRFANLEVFTVRFAEDPSLAFRAATRLGELMVSFIIVLINS